MKINNLLEAKSIEELTQWLDAHATVEKCCWVICSIKPEPGKLLYLDVVETALCYGWIDGIKKKVTSTDTAQRISPRVKGSLWTELNKERVRRLQKLGRMTRMGEEVLPDMDVRNFIIQNEILECLTLDQEVYQNFVSLPELYKRIKIDNIQTVYKDKELFNKRLDKFIASLKQNKLIGQWHDNGRLLEY